MSTVPPPKIRYDNLTSNPFFINGNPTAVSDQHRYNSTYDLNGTNQWLSTSVKPISGGSGDRHSIAIWIKRPSGTGSSSQVLFSQLGIPTLENRTFTLYCSGTGPSLSCQFHSSDSDYIRSQIQTGQDGWDDNNWHQIMATVNGNSLNLYIDGNEFNSYLSKNSVVGGGFTGVPSTTEFLSIGNNTGGTQYGNNLVSRPTFWEGVELNANQVLEEYRQELRRIKGSGSVYKPIYNKAYERAYNSSFS